MQRFSLRSLAPGFAFLAIAAGFSGLARADIIGSFESGKSGDYYYTATANPGVGTGATSTFETVTTKNGTTQGAVLGVFLFSDSAIAAGAPAGPILATINLTSTSTGSAGSSTTGSPPVTTDSQDEFSGQYQITGAPGSGYDGVNLLSATFAHASIKGTQGGNTISFSDSTNAGGTINFTSAVLGPITPPKDFSFTLSNLTSTLGLATVHGQTVLNTFHGSDVETQAGSLTPEPSSMALAALGAFGLVGYGLRRRKAMGA
jgi:hypothetical protein